MDSNPMFAAPSLDDFNQAVDRLFGASRIQPHPLAALNPESRWVLPFRSTYDGDLMTHTAWLRLARARQGSE